MKTSLLLVSLGLLFNATAAFKYMGTNQAGPEFGSNLPGTYMVDYTFPVTSSLDYFINNGMNTIRLPFLWERIQPSLNGAFDAKYLGFINSTVQYVTMTKGAYIVLDVHNYGRYRDVPIGQGVDYSAFQNLWQQLAGLYKSNPRVIFGLMNEPHDMPYANVYQAMQAGINGIRASGATNLITVPGNDWTGAHSWMASAPYMAAITDPLNNFMYEMHQYFDNNFSGNGACVSSFNPADQFGAATAWLRSNGKTAFLGEFGIESSPQCLVVLAETMAYLQANSDVWVGWTWWAAGPWWGPYKFSLEKGVGDAQFATMKVYMSLSNSPTPAAKPSPPSSATQPTPATTGNALPATTGRVLPATTGQVLPSTTGRVKAASGTTGANGGSSIPPGTSSNCTSGFMKCLSDDAYSTCNWGLWGGAQKCPAGNSCQQTGNYIYCVKAATSPTPVPAPASTTGAVPASTTGAVPASTTGSAPSAAPVPNPTPSPSTPSAPSSDQCDLGQLRCVSSNQYQSCGNGLKGYQWGPAQSCQKGLSCHPFGNQVYCY